MGAPKGNKNAIKRNHIISDTMRRVLTQNPKKVRAACEKALDMAAEGDLQYLRELADRTEGKTGQTDQGLGENGDTPMSLTVNFVTPKNGRNNDT